MLSERQRAIYKAIQREPGHDDQGISLRRLASVTGLSVNTLRRDLSEMARLGWTQLSYGKHRRTCFRLCNPLRERELERFEKLKLRLQNAPYRGEALLKSILDIIVAESHFIDNARPSFLINPLTHLPLEYDRFYPNLRVAIEFNGSQHERPTDLVPDNKRVRTQIARDLIKESLSRKHGVTLLVFGPQDLSLTAVARKVKGHLPLRAISPDDPSLALIEEYTRAYRFRSIPALKGVGRPAKEH